jgi:hypothetical protein
MACISNVWGIVRPSALAVFRLTTSSILVGSSTGRSAGFARPTIREIRPVGHEAPRFEIAARTLHRRQPRGQRQDIEVLLRLTAPHQLLAHWRSRLTPASNGPMELALRAAQVARRLYAERPKAFRQRIEALSEQGDWS